MCRTAGDAYVVKDGGTYHTFSAAHSGVWSQTAMCTTFIMGVPSRHRPKSMDMVSMGETMSAKLSSYYCLAQRSYQCHQQRLRPLQDNMVVLLSPPIKMRTRTKTFWEWLNIWVLQKV